MTTLATYQFPTTGHDVRTVLSGGEPWFVARDVCAVLDITNGRDAVSRLDADGVGTTDLIDSMGRTQTASIVNEAGLYELIFQSRKPEAKAFRRWVTGEVLPAIRRTGRYEVELSGSEVARRWYEAELAREAAQQQLAVAAPKADAWDVLAAAEGDYAVRDAAFVLNRDPAINTGQNRLFDWLRANRWIDDRSVPYASHAPHVTLRVYEHDGRTHQQVRITAAGLALLHKRLGGSSPLADLIALTA